MTTPIHRTYRITIDIETTSYSEHCEDNSQDALKAGSHHAIIERLKAHPEVLDPLLHSLVIGKLDEASKLLKVEYVHHISEQELFKPIMAELEPELQDYLIEELEEGYQAYYFDDLQTNVKCYQMALLESN